MDVSVTVSPIKDAAGDVVGASKIARDITEEKRAEEDLRWKTAFLEAQVDSSPDGVLVIDGHGKKLQQNQRFTDLLKIPQHIADDADEEKQILWIKGMAKDPVAFTAKVVHLDMHPDEISHDELALKDGEILDRYSAPVIGKDGKHYGRVVTFSIASANDAFGGVTLEFADHGIGIVPELLPLIFDPLRQGNDSMQGRYGGLGLGLFIAKGLTEAQHGTLTVASEGYGQGATFRLRLKTIVETAQ